MKYTFYVDKYHEEEKYVVGDEVLVFGETDTNTGEETFGISKNSASTGLAGNLNPNEKRFHGWRGTTNNISVWAYGVYRITSVEDNGDIVKIKIGRKDLKGGRNYED